MPETPLTDAIVALTTYANTVTGASDTTLSDAVDTLTAGFGAGASLEFIKTVTLAAAANEVNIDISDLTSDYKMIIIRSTMHFSTDDWFYPNYWVGATRKTMTGYTSKVSEYAATWALIELSDEKIVVGPPNAAFFVTDTVTGLGGHCSTGTVTVVSGTAFDIYGVKYTI